MTKQATTRNAADDATNAVDDAANVVNNVATDAKTLAVDAGDEVAERTVVGIKEASANAVALTADAQKSLDETVEKVTQRLQGVSAFSPQNLEAFARSSEITATALKDIGGEVAAYTKRSFEDRVAAAQDISTAKSLTELVEKQTSFAQHAFENWAERAIRMSEIYTSAVKNIAAPLGERFSSATKEMKSIGR
jgi:phasin family protein